jgi:hypothetical protein
MKFILADDVRDVLKAALIEFKPKPAKETGTTPGRRPPLRSSVQP